jgi:predicted phosphohydrolase
VFFLGDNVYQAGIPPLDDPSRAQAEARLEAQVHRLDGYPGKVHFIPGNHDWNISRAGGRAAILREGQWLEERLGHLDVLLPANACGDPHVLALTPDLTAIFIDSEWYLHDWEKEPHQNEGCALQTREAFSRNLKDIVLAQGDKEIVILMHHPPFTQGEHGGKFSLQEHLFPLRVIDPHLWIPLPVIGSLPILLRKAGFSRQDRSNAHYQNLIQAVMEATDGAPHVVFASGHDHNLQLFEEAGRTFVVSGSGSKSNYVAKNGRARFTSRLPGWARLDYYPQGHVWISYFTPEPEGTGTRLLFRHPIR